MMNFLVFVSIITTISIVGCLFQDWLERMSPNEIENKFKELDRSLVELDKQITALENKVNLEKKSYEPFM